MNGRPVLCPSARCEEGAHLLGIVTREGLIHYLGMPLELTAEFIAEAGKTHKPETRFRFASPCRKCECGNWKQGRCEVVEVCLAEERPRLKADAELPACGIRQECRWHLQEGANACRTCPTVITSGGADLEMFNMR